MLKKTITYTDYNGVRRTEDFYFNLTKAELIEWQYGNDEGLSDKIERIVNANDTSTIMSMFKDILLKSYGKKSEDGRRFIKSPEISKEFEESPAYDDLFVTLSTNSDAAGKFISALVPDDMKAQVKAEIDKRKAAGDPLFQNDSSGAAQNGLALATE